MTSFLFRGEITRPGSWRLWKGGLADILGGHFFVIVSSHSLEQWFSNWGPLDGTRGAAKKL